MGAHSAGKVALAKPEGLLELGAQNFMERCPISVGYHIILEMPVGD